MLVIKGYRIEAIENDSMSKDEHSCINFKSRGIRSKISQFKEIRFNWISPIKLQDIKDVFLGKDIIRHATTPLSFARNLRFNINATYQSFLRLAQNNWVLKYYIAADSNFIQLCLYRSSIFYMRASYLFYLFLYFRWVSALLLFVLFLVSLN